MSWRNVNTAFLALCAISEVHSGPRGSRFQLSAGRTQPTTASKTQAVVKLALLRQSPSAPLSVIGNLFSIFNARKQPREEIKLNCIKKRTKGKEKRTLVRTLHFCKRWWVLATTCFFFVSTVLFKYCRKHLCRKLNILFTYGDGTMAPQLLKQG